MILLTERQPNLRFATGTSTPVTPPLFPNLQLSFSIANREGRRDQAFLLRLQHDSFLIQVIVIAIVLLKFFAVAPAEKGYYTIDNSATTHGNPRVF
jgi:hypothetical protein